MRLPTPLSRRDPRSFKNTHGHLLILAGSPRMLGAAALCSLAAIRSGAGLVTLGISKSLNLTAQRKISHSIMTLPLAETPQKTISYSALNHLKTELFLYQALALGPGLSQNLSTQRFILKLIETASIPLVIDADALNALAKQPQALLKTDVPKILTPHPGEMSRLTGYKKTTIQDNRREVALEFAKKYKCILLLKGDRTIVAACDGKSTINKTGNAGLATAGSGDVLTGIIGAFLGQGLPPFDAARTGAFVHGLAGDLAAAKKTRTAMIASDIIDFIPAAFRKMV